MADNRYKLINQGLPGNVSFQLEDLEGTETIVWNKLAWRWDAGPTSSGPVPGVTDHDDLENVTPDQHHDQEHAHDGTDGSGLIDHDNLVNVTPDQHHAQVHKLYGSDHKDVDLRFILNEGDVLQYNKTLQLWQPGPGGNDDCYCIKLCEGGTPPPPIPQEWTCDAMDTWASEFGSTATDWLFRAYNDDYTDQSPPIEEIGLVNLGSRADTMNTNLQSYIAIVNTGNFYDNNYGPCDNLQTGAFPGASGYHSLDEDLRGDRTLVGVGDSITIGGFFRPARTDSSSYALFGWGAPNDAGWQLGYNAFTGYLYAQQGADNNAYVRVAIQDDALKAVAANLDRKWIHLTLYMSRLASAWAMTVYADGVLVGTAVQTEDRDGDPIADSIHYNLDDGAIGDRYPAWGWGGNGSRDGWNGAMLWPYGSAGDHSATLANTIQVYGFAPQDPDYIPPPPDPSDPGPVVFEVGDVLEVSAVDPDTGIATWCPVSGPMSKTVFQATEPTADEWRVGDMWGQGYE